MAPMYSRLVRSRQRLSERQALLLLGLSLILIIVFLTIGLPLLFKISSSLSGLRRAKNPLFEDQSFTPTPPRLSQEFVATKSAQIKISGVADANSTVELFQNNQSQGTTLTSDQSTFSFEVTLQNGENLFTAQAISPSGKKSDHSPVYQIDLLVSPPSLVLDHPQDGQTTTEKTIEVSGQTDPNTSVFINDRLALVTSDGRFRHNLALSPGENKIRIVAIDQAGNETTRQISVKFNP